MKLLKITGIVLLVLIILLIPLFGTYVATVQALPDERIYPIKRQTETVIDNLSTISPNVYAYFSLLKAQRRYQEVIGLVAKNKDITGSDGAFLVQTRQTLLDIQGVSDENSRINFYSQYQTFITSAKENFAYQIDALQRELKRDKSAGVKTFSAEAFESQGGRLVAKPTTLIQKDLVEKEPVEDSLLISNIEKLESINTTLEGLVNKL